MAGHVDVERWSSVYERPESPTLAAIVHRTLAPDYPDDVVPTTLWPAWPLPVLLEALALDRDDTLADVGCGRAGIGIWLAAASGARLIGVDPIDGALADARVAAAERIPGRARFVAGHFLDTGLDDATVDGVLVADAFHFATDQPAALRELARVLRPGGRLVMTLSHRDGSPATLEPAFAAAGFVDVTMEETPAWRERMRAFATAIEESAETLAAELGAAPVPPAMVRSTIARAWHGLVRARRGPR